jgi:glycosyltransferase involved in cell wall biosynthesis
MKKLLLINSGINSGSTGRIAEEIGLLANSNGWTSYIAYGRTENKSQLEKIKMGNKLSLYWHVLLTRLFDWHGLASSRATQKLIEQIQTINPDIIHLHNIHGYYLNYKILFQYLKKSNIPVVWTLHDCWAFTGHCVYFDYIKCDKWKTQCNQCPQKKTYPSSFFKDRSRQNFSSKKESFLYNQDLLTLVPVSNWLADLCSQSFFKNTSIKQIYNGVNINIFKPASEEKKNEILKKYNIKTNFLILGIASVWSKRKGLDDFIKLSNLIPDDYSILLVGLTAKQIKKLPPQIIGIKRTENVNELAVIYSVADVFISPTWEDNFPTTNLEALACGTPIITYKTGGSIEAVSKETGFIVEKGDVDTVLSAVWKIKNKGKSFYAENCRKRAIELYNKDERFNDYIELYEKLMVL